MSTSESLLVHISYPEIDKLVDVARVAVVDPRIEFVITSYVENTELRTAKRLRPDSPDLAAMSPLLDDAYRDGHAIGIDKIMWSTDYPHTNSNWPSSQRIAAYAFRDVAEAERRQIMRDNALRQHGLA